MKKIDNLAATMQHFMNVEIVRNDDGTVELKNVVYPDRKLYPDLKRLVIKQWFPDIYKHWLEEYLSELETCDDLFVMFQIGMMIAMIHPALNKQRYIPYGFANIQGKDGNVDKLDILLATNPVEHVITHYPFHSL